MYHPALTTPIAMSLKPYTIKYRDPLTWEFREFCCYAFDAYHARVEAAELVPAIHDHPNCVVHVLRESDHFDW